MYNHISDAFEVENDEGDEASPFKIHMLIASTSERLTKTTSPIKHSQSSKPHPRSHKVDPRQIQLETAAACLDTGTQHSVRGMDQAMSYNKLHPG